MAIQASLFDNLPLDKALSSLEKLEFSMAVRHYREALQKGANEEEVSAGISACAFWEECLSSSVDSTSMEVCTKLLKDYLQYNFSDCPAGLKKNLLPKIGEKFCIEEDADLEEVVQLFDILLENKYFTEAAKLIAHYQEIYKNEHQLYYFLAQAQHKDGYYAEANASYIKALILHPSLQYNKRIEEKKLMETIEHRGMHWAPAYSLMRGLSSNVSFEDTRSFTEDQQKYFLAYQLILQAEKTPGIDMELRKRISELSADLLKEYLDLQERRKR